MRTIAAVLFLAFQLGMIVYARFDAGRYYCWAPHDEHARYEIQIEIDGDSLEPSEIQERYRIRARSVDPRAIEHIQRIVRHYEQLHGIDDHAQVTVTYEINGGASQTWSWPEA